MFSSWNEVSAFLFCFSNYIFYYLIGSFIQYTPYWKLIFPCVSTSITYVILKLTPSKSHCLCGTYFKIHVNCRLFFIKNLSVRYFNRLFHSKIRHFVLIKGTLRVHEVCFVVVWGAFRFLKTPYFFLDKCTRYWVETYLSFQHSPSVTSCIFHTINPTTGWQLYHFFSHLYFIMQSYDLQKQQVLCNLPVSRTYTHCTFFKYRRHPLVNFIWCHRMQM